MMIAEQTAAPALARTLLSDGWPVVKRLESTRATRPWRTILIPAQPTAVQRISRRDDGSTSASLMAIRPAFLQS